MKRRMIGAWLALMITASSLVVSASPAADMSSVSADPQQEQTEPEEEEEAPDIPVTDQPGEAEMPVPTALPEPETVEEAFEESKDNTENTDSDELIEPEEEPEAASKEGENIALTEIPEQTEDPGFTVFTEENAEILTGESEEDQELIQDIENGEIIALSAALPGEFRETGSAEVISEGEDAIQLQHFPRPSIIWTAGPGFTAMRSGQLPMIFLVPEIKPVWDVRIVLYIILMIQERKRFRLSIA